jgi:predicted nucleic acid-binding Zn finger protein
MNKVQSCTLMIVLEISTREGFSCQKVGSNYCLSGKFCSCSTFASQLNDTFQPFCEHLLAISLSKRLDRMKHETVSKEAFDALVFQ